MARALTRLSGRETNRIHRAGKGKGRSHEFAAPTNRGKGAAMVEGKDYRILNNRKLQEEGRRNCVSCAIRARKRVQSGSGGILQWGRTKSSLYKRMDSAHRYSTPREPLSPALLTHTKRSHHGWMQRQSRTGSPLVTTSQRENSASYSCMEVGHARTPSRIDQCVPSRDLLRDQNSRVRRRNRGSAFENAGGSERRANHGMAVHRACCARRAGGFAEGQAGSGRAVLLLRSFTSRATFAAAGGRTIMAHDSRGSASNEKRGCKGRTVNFPAPGKEQPNPYCSNRTAGQVYSGATGRPLEAQGAARRGTRKRKKASGLESRQT